MVQNGDSDELLQGCKARTVDPTSPRDEARLTLSEHLDEPRFRTIKVETTFFAAAIAARFFWEQIFDLLLASAADFKGKPNYTATAEALLSSVKLLLYAALVLTVLCCSTRYGLSWLRRSGR